MRVEFLKSIRRAGAFLALLAAAPPVPAFATDAWRIDPARTSIGFAIDAVGFPRTEGRFRRFEGRISVDFDHPNRSSVVFHVQSQSVDVGSPSALVLVFLAGVALVGDAVRAGEPAPARKVHIQIEPTILDRKLATRHRPRRDVLSKRVHQLTVMTKKLSEE